MNFNKYAKEIHANNIAAGWWEGEQCLRQKCMLIVSEVVEAMEGARKDLMDTHLLHRKMLEVELADALIRVLDLAGKLSLDLSLGVKPGGTASAPSPATLDGQGSIGSQLFGIVEDVVDFAKHLPDQGCSRNAAFWCGNVVASIVEVAENNDCDLEAAMNEKRAYNKNRADHKRENRTGKVGEKKF